MVKNRLEIKNVQKSDGGIFIISVKSESRTLMANINVSIYGKYII